QFVSDAAGAELERYALQSPELELALLRGTNRVYSIAFGASPTNTPTAIYAQLSAHTNVVLVPVALSDFLKQPYKSFHDPRLVTFNSEALAQIAVNSIENYVLTRATNGLWNGGLTA